MHLGNGAIAPECAAVTLGLAAVGLGAAVAVAGRQPLTRERLALAAALGGLVFAAQAINVPVLPGISAHLVGGALLAWVLGPGLGAGTMAIVLAMQALALGDGGLAALGANVLNMALLPAGCVAICQRVSKEHAGRSWACLVAGFVSVPLAAALIVGETAAFRSATELGPWQDFAARMMATHLWIGLLEGGLTLVAVLAIGWISAQAAAGKTFRAAPAAACAAAAMAIATAAFPWSSVLPDGYEGAAEAAGLGAWLAEGSGAISQIQAQAVALTHSACPSEQGCLIVAMLLTAAAIAGFATVMARPVSKPAC